MKIIYSIVLLAFLQFCTSTSFAKNSNLQPPTPTRLLSQPALSAERIAFVYAEDLWIADRDGQNPRRITVDNGIESNPVFSPDGKTLAFNTVYDGNMDVFVVAAEGGVPKRLTWHPGSDVVRDFTPDGNSVLFGSRREVFTNRHNQLFTVSVNGGQITPLNIPTAYAAAYSADGKKLAYTPLGEAFTQWKNYRGGRVSRIWVYTIADRSVIEIPKPETGSNDPRPQWLNGKVYFRSDRNGEFNLFSYDPENKVVKQLTTYTDFPVLDLSIGDGEIIFEQAGYLHIFNPKTNTSEQLDLTINTDLPDLRTRYVSGKQHIRTASVSPSGARVVVDYRGDILTAPAKKGDVQNLTNTPSVHENYPTWSPNGKKIAYFSDASGEYALHIFDTKESKAKELKLDGTGFYAHPHWSPDSEKIAFVDNGRNLYIMNVADGTSIKVATDYYYMPGPFRELFGDWSHDSNWLSYSIITSTNFEQAFLYDLKNKKAHPISDGLSNATEPVFDPSGKYLYLSVSTDAGPVINWFQQSNLDMRLSNSIYLVTLQKETLSPLKKENDEEMGDIEEKKEEEKEKKTDDLVIDFENIETRIIDLPISAGLYYNLAVAKEGELYYISSKESGRTLHKYSLKDREDKEIMPADWFEIAAGGEKMFYGKNGNWGITNVGEKSEDDLVNTDALQVKIVPQEEWKNIFAEAWRVNRDYFYDPNMHGADWDAMREKYEPFLANLTSRSDLYQVMEWMFSELGVGHHRFGSRGDALDKRGETIKGGLLGADYEVANNRYRFKKIYGGLNWNPNLRSPLTEPGINVKAGEYLIAVDGQEVTADQNLYQFFENTADRIVELTVGANANGSSGARTVKVVPVESEYGLRNRDWVEGNIRKVDAATNGQVAYVHVPNTTSAGHEYFKRYFFPQVNKKAIIVDERFNGGGQIADYYIELLTRPYQNSWTYRHGHDQNAPIASIQGPKVLLTDETAGSGGDLFPYLWRQNKLGPIVGKRTWGGLVGILGYPEFIDGGVVMAPNVAFWDDKGYRVENEGIAPDVEVEQLPSEVMAGRDPQLEKAIEIVLKSLKENPPFEPKRPAFETRTWKEN